MRNVSNRHMTDLYLRSFGLQKVISLIHFFDKKYQKKLLNINVLVAAINQAGLSKKNFFFTFITTYLQRLLLCLRSIGFLFDFFFIPVKFCIHFLFFGVFSSFLNTVSIVYLKNGNLKSSVRRKIYLFSKPARQVYLNYQSLQKLNRFGQEIYVFSTPFGLLTHTELLQKKQGGTLLLVI